MSLGQTGGMQIENPLTMRDLGASSEELVPCDRGASASLLGSDGADGGQTRTMRKLTRRPRATCCGERVSHEGLEDGRRVMVGCVWCVRRFVEAGR